MGEANLLHPLSQRVRIGLPPVLPLVIVTLRKALLVSCSSPWTSKDFVLIIIYGGALGLVFFWRPGGKSWTILETPELTFFDDITYHKDQFYGVDMLGKVFACDFGGPNPNPNPNTKSNPTAAAARVVGEIPIKFPCSKRPYIVELVGEFVMVVRDVCDHSSNLHLDPDSPADETSEFQVFPVNVRSGRWEEMKSLGDNAPFLGRSSSISVAASKFPGIRANCIYYADDCWVKHGGSKDMGIYSLEDGSRKPWYKGESFSPIYPPMFVCLSGLHCPQVFCY